MQAGIATKLKHIPLGISVLYNNLEKWDLTYNDPLNPDNQVDPITGQTKKKSDVGFTYGFGLRIKMFTLSYARATYMTGTFNPNYFSLAMNLGQFSKKKE